MPKGERFFYRHKLNVIDGTPCEAEKNDVCVEGKCMVSYQKIFMLIMFRRKNPLS